MTKYTGACVYRDVHVYVFTGKFTAMTKHLSEIPQLNEIKVK